MAAGHTFSVDRGETKPVCDPTVYGSDMDSLWRLRRRTDND